MVAFLGELTVHRAYPDRYRGWGRLPLSGCVVKRKTVRASSGGSSRCCKSQRDVCLLTPLVALAHDGVAIGQCDVCLSAPWLLWPMRAVPRHAPPRSVSSCPAPSCPAPPRPVLPRLWLDVFPPGVCRAAARIRCRCAMACTCATLAGCDQGGARRAGGTG